MQMIRITSIRNISNLTINDMFRIATHIFDIQKIIKQTFLWLFSKLFKIDDFYKYRKDIKINFVTYLSTVSLFRKSAIVSINNTDSRRTFCHLLFHLKILNLSKQVHFTITCRK